ncbi:MAG TPA: hypothetical protein VGM05_33790 [Planctomycetaceae bacterium]|jgi:hypothetical protein
MENSDRRQIPWLATARKLLLLLAWGLWWGGLCFYAVVVVPIGTETIGSVEQGFITQQVTWWHNLVTGLFLAGLTAEACRRRSRMLILASSVLGIIEISLILWHAHLTGMMDFPNQAVPPNFYGEHAIYLWITAAEWGLGIILPVWLFPATDQMQRS